MHSGTKPSLVLRWSTPSPWTTSAWLVSSLGLLGSVLRGRELRGPSRRSAASEKCVSVATGSVANLWQEMHTHTATRGRVACEGRIPHGCSGSHPQNMTQCNPQHPFHSTRTPCGEANDRSLVVCVCIPCHEFTTVGVATETQLLIVAP